MSAPLSFCDISARPGQMPAPPATAEGQTGWNPNLLFKDYLNKVRRYRKEQEEHAAEDALMAVIDAMNAPKEERRTDPEKVAAQSLMRAGPSIQQSEKFQELREKCGGKIDLAVMPEIRALLMCLGDVSMFRQMDEIQENTEKALEEQAEEEERLEVTEARGPSEISEFVQIEKEV